jgi:hypothetical protein
LKSKSEETQKPPSWSFFGDTQERTTAFLKLFFFPLFFFSFCIASSPEGGYLSERREGGFLRKERRRDWKSRIGGYSEEKWVLSPLLRETLKKTLFFQQRFLRPYHP